MSGSRLTPDAKASLMQIARYTQQQWGKQQLLLLVKCIKHDIADLHKVIDSSTRRVLNNS